ncbi:hypothetical protein PISMIDRAFT_686882 [Pisolithus microcarpus 441]|uniref:Uncharacterized protein n=1 Tax=Pisolithus microcarpus 441 TaxID=765257 RepID=A0A0C9YH50_9AGAM|nr:hypothetical protein PISMIDRAFT_686882 [Pisolithus microcarpus 441]
MIRSETSKSRPCKAPRNKHDKERRAQHVRTIYKPTRAITDRNGRPIWRVLGKSRSPRATCSERMRIGDPGECPVESRGYPSGGTPTYSRQTPRGSDTDKRS